MAADDHVPTGEAAAQEPVWADWSDEQLLGLRFCDLRLSSEGSWLEARIEELYGDLEAAGIAFRPHFWLSDEWFTPDGMTGIAIPFYLAHPRLSKLEETMMLEVEGGTPHWCMKILRHEAGHAIDNAYRLQRRRARQRLFGRTSQPYPEYYAPRPYSKSFVLIFRAIVEERHPFLQILPVLRAVEGEDVESFVRAAARTLVEQLRRHPDFLNLMLIEIVEFKARHVPGFFGKFLPMTGPLMQRLAPMQGSVRAIPGLVLAVLFIRAWCSDSPFFITRRVEKVKSFEDVRWCDLSGLDLGRGPG